MKYSGTVLVGIVVFIVFLTSPFWLNAGKSSVRPELEMPAYEKQCVEPVEYMRANHMQLLDDWRNDVVRDGLRTYVNSEGKEFDKSLTLTCLGCHENKKNFCDKCHDYAGVTPYCWKCHIDPKEIQ